MIGFPELYFQAQSIFDQNYKEIQLLIVICFWYLVMTSILYVGQYYLEKKVGQGFSRSDRAGFKDRWLSLGRWVAVTAEVMVKAESVYKRFGHNEVLKA